MGNGEIRTKQQTRPLGKGKPGAAASKLPPAPEPGAAPQPRDGGPMATKPSDAAKLTAAARAGQRNPAGDLAGYPLPKPDLESSIQRQLAEPDSRGVVGDAVAYWHDMREEDCVSGYVGAVMETLLEFSGLPSVERSAAELGARVGHHDSNANIAKAGGKLALHSGLAFLNGLAAGGALASAGKAGKALVAGEAVSTGALATTTVVRHYTSVESAMQVMKSGELWASGRGMCGTDKIYLLAEKTGPRGLNFLRRLNIGMPPKTAAAIEIDLAKLPADVAAKFKIEGFRGFVNGENYITHAGTFDFTAFRGAVKYVDTQTIATTLDQVLKAGGQLLNVAAVTADAAQGAAGLANVKP